MRFYLDDDDNHVGVVDTVDQSVVYVLSDALADVHRDNHFDVDELVCCSYLVVSSGSGPHF